MTRMAEHAQWISYVLNILDEDEDVPEPDVREKMDPLAATNHVTVATGYPC